MCIRIHMRTNVVLDDELVAEAFRLSTCKTKKDLLHEALQYFIRDRRRRNLLDLAGKELLAPDYDYKKARR